MTKIFKLDELDFSKITYSEPDIGKTSNIIYMTYNNNQSILIETPELYCVDKIEQNKTKYTTHELIITLYGKNQKITDETKKFFENLDNKFIDLFKKNKNIWLSESKNIKYKSIIRYIDEDNNYYENGVIKIKFIKTKNFTTLLFDKNKNIILQEDYEKVLSGNVYVKIIFEIVSIWIKNNIFGVYLRPYQIKVSKGNIPLLLQDKYSFDDNSESDNEDKFLCDTECIPKLNITMNNNKNKKLEIESTEFLIDSIIYNDNKLNNDQNDFEYILSDTDSEK